MLSDDKIIDITRNIRSDMVIWPGDVGVRYRAFRSMKGGDFCNVTDMSIGLHTGTHIDAPLHFIDDGASIDEMPLSHFIGDARVIYVDTKGCITLEHIKDKGIKRNDIVLFKTCNSEIEESEPFFKDYVYLEIKAAKFLVEIGVKTVGIDYLSVDSFYDKDVKVHKLLLSNNIAIIETINLKGVAEGIYFISCLPLKMGGVEASPCRCIIVKKNEYFNKRI